MVFGSALNIALFILVVVDALFMGTFFLLFLKVSKLLC